MGCISRLRILLLLPLIGLLSLGSCVDGDSLPDDHRDRSPDFKRYDVVADINLPNGNFITFRGKFVEGKANWIAKPHNIFFNFRAVDNAFHNAILSFQLEGIDKPGRYTLSSNDSVHKPVVFAWDGMNYNHWKGYTTGDVDDDGRADDEGFITIETLDDHKTKGRFSMKLGNDLCEKITIDGQFSGKVRYIEK